LKKNLIHRSFKILPVLSSVCNKKIFAKKYGVTSLVLKIDATEIDAIDGKRGPGLLLCSRTVQP